MKYYIADCHFGDSKILEYGFRQFKTVEEMDKSMITLWNARVTADDDVYIIGDLIYRSENPGEYLSKLKGRLHLILGNHDKEIANTEKYQKRFKTITPYLVINDKKHRLVLFHYPMIEWDGYYFDSWQIHGHIHNHSSASQILASSFPKLLNASAELLDYTPRTFDELVEINRSFKEKELDV